MAEKKTIKRDMDRVYDNPNATCIFIQSYVLSKGDLKTNKVSNKFCNIEVLKNGLFVYLVVTSGRLGDSNVNVIARRFNSEKIVKQIYLEECAKREKEGYSKVEVVSIFPNCSEAAKKYVAENRIISKTEAKKIAEEKADKLDKINPVKRGEVKKIELDPKVVKLVQNIYFEANQAIKSVLSPDSFMRTDTPLGMISLKMIDMGRAYLKDIGVLHNKLATAKRNINGIREQIAELSNMYNMTIPRIIKRGSTDWLLDTPDKVMEQYEFLDLLEVALSSAVLNSTTSVDIEGQYMALNSDISLVTDKKIINEVIDKMKSEQLETHHFRTRLLNVFEVNQKNAPTFDGSVGNVVSLFHGTRAANLYGILSTNIKLPRNLGPNVQLTGAMFGPGVYFGQYSKSLQYSTARFGGSKNKSNKYYLFLCDVALGKVKFEEYSKSYAQAPSGYNSVMGVGQEAFKKGCFIQGVGDTKDFKIPKDVFLRNLPHNSSLLYNEFILYNQNRYRIRYIIEVEEC